MHTAALTILHLALALQPAATPAPPASPAPAGAAAGAAPVIPVDEPVAGFSSATDLLTRLEAADRGMQTLRADVQYTKTFAAIQGGDQQIRRGKLYYQAALATPPGAKADQARPRRAFSVIFDTLIIGSALRKQTQHFIFDGVHLVERNLDDKQFLKRRVVKPGDTIDPLRLGEGPFPLPIGQKRDAILARFNARLLKPETGYGGPLPEVLNGTVQLLLIPKPGTTEARDFDEVRLWYRTTDLLPRLARTSTPAGAASEVLLINLAQNQTLPPGVFDVEPPKEPGWQVDIREDFRGLNEAERAAQQP
jgi:hypothetical protein